MKEKIAIIGLGYVGLPLAVALGEKFQDVVGFDINESRVSELRRGRDRNLEIPEARLKNSNIEFTSKEERLKDRTFFIVTVPTPIDQSKRPDLSILKSATEIVGRNLSPGSVIVYESTVYPGVTEEFCGPILEETSGLKRGRDFKLGYSPERINPSDRKHTLEKVVKVIAAEDEESLERIKVVYGSVIEAGLHIAPSIPVAEAAKVIENVQRDLNIALMNELAIIFDRMGLRTADVLAAAKTKWNFIPFTPGLVGGHCIGVDPYYLTAKAESLGYHPEVILSGRRINASMGVFIAQKTIKLLIDADNISIKQARVGILGLTFKENIPDLRNSRVPDIADELRSFGIEPLIHDPLAYPEEAKIKYGITLAKWEELQQLDAMIIAVAHKYYSEMPLEKLLSPLRKGGVIVDVKSILQPNQIPDGYRYWSL